MYAEVAVYQANVRGTFHYEIPDGWPVWVGHLVDVGFRTARSQGIVLATTETSPVARTRPILDIILPEPVVTEDQIVLSRWLADHTLTPIAACLWLWLPPGLAKRGDALFTLIDDSANSPIATLLKERGPLRGAQLDRAIPGWRTKMRTLLEKGVVRRETILPPPDAKARMIRMAQLAMPPAEIPAQRGAKAAAVITYLSGQTAPVPVDEIAGAESAVLARLVDQGVITITESEHWRDPLAGKVFVAATPPPLTPGQAAAWTQIAAQIDSAERPVTYLLHGVTGSGKTEIYLRAIERTLAQGKTAIVLVPEIALVPQTVRRFAARFPDRVALVHSGLTDGEQYDTWRRARAGEIGVVIGTRSALFTPLPNLGLIVLDEEHDDSYKQAPPIPPPYYHARDVAMALLRPVNGTVILGSATPDITTFYRANAGEIAYIRLPDRVLAHRQRITEQAVELAAQVPTAAPTHYAPADAPDAMSAALPPVEVVDMRHELKAGNRSMFSRSLRAALEEVLALNEGAILLLNRRGTASFVLCRDCGYVAKCPRCDMPLTYHESAEWLACHYCGYHAAQPETCPQCGGKRIKYFGAGTASVEAAVKAEFPAARVVRWDRDTTRARGSHDEILDRFVAGEANVMVGTQMIAKGLDIPRVTLVGVILADVGLGLPDYRAGERAFQLLTQVAGRAGRGPLGGRVVLQTYQPDHYAIRAAAGHDYAAFYAQEIAYRQVLRYPPFKRLIHFKFGDTNPATVEREAEALAERLRRRIADRSLGATEIVGPAPSFFGRIDNIFYWHIVARTTDPDGLLEGLDVRGWWVDSDPLDIL
jgi:primosomal protein N' (replication factor Y)